MIKAIIFDLDNTLFDFWKMKWRSVNAAAEAMIDAGFPMKKKDIHAEIQRIFDVKGLEYQLVFDDFIHKFFPNIETRFLAAGIVAYRAEKKRRMKLYPKVRPTLKKCRKMGLKMGILSDAPKLQAWTRLYDLNIAQYFDSVVTVDDTGYHKPAPEPFKLIKKRLKVKAKQCVMVGDWPERDILGAQALGMKAIWARYGLVWEDVETSTAELEVDCLDEIIPFLKRSR